MARLRNAAGRALVGAGLGFLVVVVPFLGVRKDLFWSHWPWQEHAVAVIAVCAGAAVCALSRTLAITVKPAQLAVARQGRFATVLPYLPRAAGLFYVFLFCCAIALCLRMHLVVVHVGLADFAVRLLGLMFLCAGAAVQVGAAWSARNDQLHTGFLRIRHPLMFGWILAFIGLPLSFAAPLPLVAIPGICIGIVWRLRPLELLLEQQLGTEYRDLCQKTWQIIPFVK